MKGGESGPRAVGNRFMEIGHILCFFSRLGGDFYPPMAGCWFGWFGSWNNKKSFVKGKVTVCSTHAHTHTHGVLTVDHGPTLPHWNQSSHCGNCVWTCLDHQRIFISSALCAAEADRIWGVVWRFLALLEIDLFIYVVIFCPEIRRYGICKASCCIWICWWFVPIGSSAIWGIYSAYSLFKKHPAILLDVGQGNPIE